MEEYETIEHDMIHIKDYFKNYKFGIQERLSKLYFLNNMNTNMINDSNDLLKQSKEKLVEIKDKGKECDKFIFDISTKFFNIENETEHEKNNVKHLQEKINKKKIELNELTKQGDLYNEYETLNMKYKNVSQAIENTLNKISDLKKELEKKINYNYDELEVYREKLMSRTRRLSVIQYEKYIEDLYEFYKKMAQKILKLFNVEIYTKNENYKINILIVRSDKNELKMEIVNGRLENIKGLGNEHKEEYYKKINDPRFVIFNFLFNK